MSVVDDQDQQPSVPEKVEVKHARDTWIGLIRSGGTRMAVLPISAVIGIFNTRIIIEHYGEASYAQYGLLVGIGALLPWADLGISAAIMNVIGGSHDPSRDSKVHGVLVTCIRILCGSMVTICAVSVGISVLGLWPTIFGEGLQPGGGAVAAAVCLALLGIGMPFGIGQRILAGMGKNHVGLALLGLQAPVTLVTLLILTHWHVPAGNFVAVIPYGTAVLIALIATVLGGRMIAPMLGRSVRSAPHVRTERGGEVFSVAWPMLVQMIALPIAMQTDRIVLSHLSGTTSLAQYNLASQIYSPVWAVVSAAGFTLWPVFARERARGRHASPMSISLVFGVAAALVCLGLSLASPLLSQVATGGTIHLPVSLLVAYSLFMICQAVKYPLGMYMTDARGLRYQAVMICLLLPVNLGLSIWLTGLIGPSGPIIGSAVGVLLFQVIANVVYVRRDRAKVVGT
ncbi:oligosaccharide flippase family protein [Angustibacter luteus]|uniref:Oligosaccharide flippase family protein n=1 Tax=Angustibacter luteus TaxID=658456 RepID=A0ABW1JB34_9ACTN